LAKFSFKILKTPSSPMTKSSTDMAMVMRNGNSRQIREGLHCELLGNRFFQKSFKSAPILSEIIPSHKKGGCWTLEFQCRIPLQASQVASDGAADDRAVIFARCQRRTATEQAFRIQLKFPRMRPIPTNTKVRPFDRGRQRGIRHA
jgi:hypothetical protein